MGLAQHRLDIHMPQRKQRIRLTWVPILDIAKNRWSCRDFQEGSPSGQAVRIQNNYYDIVDMMKRASIVSTISTTRVDT